MRFQRIDDPTQRSVRFELTVTPVDLVFADRPDGFDEALRTECGGSTSIADKLLWLERLARLIEQGHARETARRSKTAEDALLHTTAW
jgi:hypothetical protein